MNIKTLQNIKKLPDQCVPDRPHLDHMRLDRGDSRGITFHDRWEANLQLGLQVAFAAGHHQRLFTVWHKLTVLLDVGDHLEHLLHGVPGGSEAEERRWLRLLPKVHSPRTSAH